MCVWIIPFLNLDMSFISIRRLMRMAADGGNVDGSSEDGDWWWWLLISTGG
jgi:hypothetical protein